MARRIKFDVDEAAELYRSGRNLDEVAARCRVSAGTVRRRLLEAGVEMRRRGGPAGTRGPEPEVDTITALYRAGHSIKAIGAAVGLSDATVWRRLRSAGVETRRPGKSISAAQPLVDVEWCRQMRDDGHSVEEIAEWLGVAPAVVAIQLEGR